MVVRKYYKRKGVGCAKRVVNCSLNAIFNSNSPARHLRLAFKAKEFIEKILFVRTVHELVP